jgi:DivIVA domain-containing protein
MAGCSATLSLTALRGYRMGEVDDVLDRLGAELAERDVRIAELEAALASAPAPRQKPQS